THIRRTTSDNRDFDGSHTDSDPGTRPGDHHGPTGNGGRGRKTRLPRRGEPGSYGYDDKGKRLPYANSRPKYDKNQVRDVFNNTNASQRRRPPRDQNGDRLDPPGENQVWVNRQDGTWDLVTWTPGQRRRDLWDMGHLPRRKYSDLRDQYLNGEISKEEFLSRYRNPRNYFAEDPGRNRSHMDE
ncbi:MAG: GH-E family nuclease, partial [Microbacterium gubbeenense]